MHALKFQGYTQKNKDTYALTMRRPCTSHQARFRQCSSPYRMKHDSNCPLRCWCCLNRKLRTRDIFQVNNSACMSTGLCLTLCTCVDGVLESVCAWACACAFSLSCWRTHLCVMWCFYMALFVRQWTIFLFFGTVLLKLLVMWLYRERGFSEYTPYLLLNSSAPVNNLFILLVQYFKSFG